MHKSCNSRNYELLMMGFHRSSSPTHPKHTFWKRQISFRDYLRKHSELIEEYNQLKLKNIKDIPAEDL